MPALAAATPVLWSDALDPPPVTTVVSATLPVAARTAFDAFGDITQTPRWLSVVQSARVARADAHGRPLQVSFLARLERATVGYSLSYRWDPTELTASWSTPDGASLRIGGDVRFLPLSTRACLMHYRLSIDTPFDSEWVNASFTGNAAAAVASEFREHLRGLG